MKFDSEGASKYPGLNGTEFPTVCGVWPGLTKYQLETALGKADSDSNADNLLWEAQGIICYMNERGICDIVNVAKSSPRTNIPDVGSAVAQVRKVMGEPLKDKSDETSIGYANGVHYRCDKDTGRVTQIDLVLVSH